MYVHVNIEAHYYNHCCCGKPVSTTHSVCVCMCVNSCLSFPVRKEYATCLLSSAAYLAVLYSSTLSHKWHDFRKKEFQNVKYVFCFSLQLGLKYFSFEDEMSKI
jgi:hypothetical protein